MELMIQAYAGQSVHNAMVDAIVAEELRRQQAARAAEETRKAEARSREMRELRMRLAMSRAQNERLNAQLIEKTGRAYRQPERRPVRDALWGLYGLAVLAAAALAEAGRAAVEVGRDAVDAAREVAERMRNEKNRRARARRKRQSRQKAKRRP